MRYQNIVFDAHLWLFPNVGTLNYDKYNGCFYYLSTILVIKLPLLCSVYSIQYNGILLL